MRPRRCATANGSTSRSRARPTSSTGSILATRFPKSRTGRGKRRTSGRPTCSTMATLPDVLFGDARRVPRARARALPGDRDGHVAGRAVRRHGPAAAARHGLRIYRSDGVRRPGQRQALPLLGLGIPADQGAGAGRRPDVVRAGQRAGRPDLAQPGEGRLPAAGRGRLGDPPRRFLLSLLLGRQLLRAGRRIWRDGRPLARARPARSRRSRKRAACRTA